MNLIIYYPSYDILVKKHHVTPELALDLSIFHPYVSLESDRPIRFITTDFYSKEFDCFVFPNGGEIFELPSLDMRQLSWPDTVDTIASSRVVITGRFHAFMACLKTKTRFIAYPGNTPKIDGVLEWFGNDTALVSNYKDLVKNAKESHRNMNYYNELFEWIDTKKPWKPYFIK